LDWLDPCSNVRDRAAGRTFLATDLRMSAFGSVPRLPAPTKRLGRAFDRRGPTGELGARHSRRERRAIPPGDPLEDPRFSQLRGGENPQRPLCRRCRYAAKSTARHACLTRAILARRGPRRAGPAPSQGRARSRRREGTRRRASARTRGYAESGEITPRLPNLTVAPKRMRSGRGSLGSRSTRRAGCPGRIPRAPRDERPPRDPREARRRT